MKIKTSELSGAQLDYAVAKCEGIELIGRRYNRLLVDGHMSQGQEMMAPYKPSTDWAQGGPVIEQEGISLYLDTNNLWQANIFDGNPAVFFGSGVEGSTPLIAAMRCYVASKLGDEIELPVELGAEVS